MAGFESMGVPGFSVAPPRINPVFGSNRLNFGGLSHITGGQAGYISPDAQIGQSRLDTSPQHQANVWLAQMGMGNLGKGSPSGFSPSDDPYGFSPGDWGSINRFQSNPLGQQNINDYQGVTSRVRSNLGSIPGFSPDMFRRFTEDLPLLANSGFNIAPPNILQNWAFSPGVLQ